MPLPSKRIPDRQKFDAPAPKKKRTVVTVDPKLTIERPEEREAVRKAIESERRRRGGGSLSGEEIKRIAEAEAQKQIAQRPTTVEVDPALKIEGSRTFTGEPRTRVGVDTGLRFGEEKTLSGFFGEPEPTETERTFTTQPGFVVDPKRKTVSKVEISKGEREFLVEGSSEDDQSVSEQFVGSVSNAEPQGFFGSLFSSISQRRAKFEMGRARGEPTGGLTLLVGGTASLVGQFPIVQERFKETVSEPIFSFVGEKTKITQKDIVDFSTSSVIEFGKIISPTTAIPFLDPLREQKGQVVRGTIGGIVEDVREKPLKQVALLGAGFGLGAGLKGFQVVSRTAGRVVGGVRGGVIGERVATATTLVGGGGLLAFEGVKIAEEVSIAPTLEQKSSIVSVAIKDIGLIGVGALGGERSATRFIGEFRTASLQQVPIETIADPKVMSGKTRFPDIAPGETASQLRSRFFEARLPGEQGGIARAFTTTDVELIARAKEIPIGKVITATGGGKRDPITGLFPKAGFETIKSEFPGRFGADVISPAFLRTGAETGQKASLFGLDLLGGEPTIIRTTLPGGIRLPKTQSGQLGLGRARAFELESLLGGRRGLTIEQIEAMKPELKPGESIVPFTKLEREIITVKKSPLTEATTRFFVDVEGTKVPIFENIAISQKTITPKTTMGKITERIRINLRQAPETSIAPPRSSILTPSRVSVGLSISNLRSTLKSSMSGLRSSGLSSLSRLSSPLSSIFPSSTTSSLTRFSSTLSSFGRGSSSISSSLSKSGSRLSSSLTSGFSSITTPPPTFGFPPLGLKQRPTKRMQRPQPKRRVPSLVSLEFGFKAFKPLKFERSGIVARPILRKRKRRGKR